MTLPIVFKRLRVEACGIADPPVTTPSKPSETKGVALVYELQLGKGLMETENINADEHGLGIASPLIAEVRIPDGVFAKMEPTDLERLLTSAAEFNLEEAVLDFSRKVEREAGETPNDSPR
jgi:hypothetical protein